jgi:hypothetical protein
MKTKLQSPRGNFNGRHIRSIAFVLSCLLAPISSQAGPVSELYLTAGQENTILVVQGSNVVRSWGVVHNNEYAIAVMGTVQTTIGASGFLGSEYTLAGAYTGVTSTFPNLPGTAVYDGASDGTYIYAWDFNQNRALRFGPNWSNPVPLFSIGGSVGDFIGITFDPSNDSLWISGWYKSEIRDYSLTGQLLSSFSVSHNEITALALDPATETLWSANRNVWGLFEEYSKTGQLLSTQYYPELSGMNVLGGEIPVPEPATAGLLTLGLLLFAIPRRSKGRK